MHELSGWDLAQIGIRQSEKNAPEEWRTTMWTAFFRAARNLPYLTADDIWNEAPPGFSLKHGSALGAIMREAQAMNWIEKTGNVERAKKPSMHCKHRPVWKSNLYVEEL